MGCDFNIDQRSRISSATRRGTSASVTLDPESNSFIW